MSVAFVFTNPRHHLEMMAPVAAELKRRGIPTAMISLAELRGFETPQNGVAIRRAIPFNVRRRNSAASPSSSDGSSRFGTLVKRLVWNLALGPRMRELLRDTRIVVVPNDAVFPYIELVQQAQRRGAKTILMQEGIRFPLPTEYVGPTYGGSNNAAVCAWGEGSRDYFIASDVPRNVVAVTGAPRLDTLDPATWRPRGEALREQLGLATAPIAFLSNPIEIQGYGTKQHKLELFERFLAEAAPVLLEQRIPVLVKNHLHEDPKDYARIAAAGPLRDLVTVVDATTPIFAAIAASRAAVVLTSTVGLEALVFGKPLGVLEIPRHDFAFEYVQRGAAIALRFGTIAEGVAELIRGAPAHSAAAEAFIERHLFDRGRARTNVADVIERVLRDQHSGQL